MHSAIAALFCTWFRTNRNRRCNIITEQDIAAAAGVSQATVSRVLRSGPWVKAEVREKVLRIAREMNYLGKVRHIAVILQKETAFLSYITMMQQAIFDEFERRNYHAQIIMEGGEQLLSTANFAGAFSLMSRSGFERRWAEEQLLPLVCLNTDPNRMNNIASVSGNDAQGVRLALDYLTARGHRRIGFLLSRIGIRAVRPEVTSGNLDDLLSRRSGSRTVRTRIQAFRQYFRRDCPGDTPYLIESDRIGEIIEFVRRERLSALIVNGESNSLAVPALLAAGGVRIPAELSVITYEDTTTSRYAVPPLTTIRQNIPEIVRRALDILEIQIRSEPAPGDLLIDYELIERASVRAL